MGVNLSQNFLQRHLFSLWIPGGVHRIAPIAAEIAARGADENRGQADQPALALERIENFGDAHRINLAKRAAA
jgi:hypothetical protein